MYCHKHVGRRALGVCMQCGRFVCQHCQQASSWQLTCRECGAVDKPDHPAAAGPTTFIKYLCYLLSLLVLPGLIIGVVFNTRSEQVYRDLGANCLLIAVFALALLCVGSPGGGDFSATFGGSRMVPYM